MRKSLIVSLLLAAATLVGGTALAQGPARVVERVQRVRPTHAVTQMPRTVERVRTERAGDSRAAYSVSRAEVCAARIGVSAERSTRTFSARSTTAPKPGKGSVRAPNGPGSGKVKGTTQVQPPRQVTCRVGTPGCTPLSH